MYMSETIFTHDAAGELRRTLEREQPAGVFLVLPQNIGSQLLTALDAPDITDRAVHIPIPQGEKHKTMATAQTVWRAMLENGATRHSMVVNLGGGMTTDLGGFAAACYMRSVRYVNIPTTLLACVDASSGGKTGVNLDGVKNIVGAFQPPVATIVCPRFLETLPERELLSGWGEMLKHALLTGADTLSRYIAADPRTVRTEDWLPLIEESVRFKSRITQADPTEKGLRRILNLGHTTGHAIEALFNSDDTKAEPVTHGHAVAFGLVTALVLSHRCHGFSSATLQRVARTVRELYPPVPLRCDHYKALLALMHCDKKNLDSELVSFVTMRAPGEAVQATPVEDDDICNALDITRDLLGV